MENETEQKDEMTALEAIYQDDFECIHAPSGGYSGRIAVHVHSTDTAAVVEKTTPDNAQPPKARHVENLPPVTVMFALPSGYPRAAPPRLSVMCSWLTREQRLELERRIGALWDEEQDVVLFRCVDLLQNMVHELPLVFPLEVSVDVMRAVVTYDCAARQEQFDSTQHTCEICFEEKRGYLCYRLSCGHVYCRDCLRDYFALLITEGSVSNVRCPDARCVKAGFRVSEDDLSSIVGAELHKRYRELVVKQALEADPSIAWCPRQQCQGPAIKDATYEKLAICQKCSLAFCYYCRKTWHGAGEYCAIDNLQRVARDYEAADAVTKKRMEIQYGHKNLAQILADAIAERESARWLSDNTTGCPTCQSSIEKAFGCNHMQCSVCDTHFCYLCGAYLSVQNALGHFNLPGTRCYQRLFENLGADEDELAAAAAREAWG
ncbi:hypothetical protein THASP1DRAFT_27213 [Thamnocephalis sphaerospora]|uniref:RBR-type E3 ubiquitin transferase n=1 Tax=Thamnocephalis sphaerospora TaxID=78915 RepID=A0A4P9XZX3_9FUNG|nr:hypothetical protein THASP1DRAFT_27213 [Thamnocephalis sphaerospora]|eukprot:RKP11040.1 hypothetical protein THASP1DRAFT_27213 [Thamnocephalis sphaerospora]